MAWRSGVVDSDDGAAPGRASSFAVETRPIEDEREGDDEPGRTGSFSNEDRWRGVIEAERRRRRRRRAASSSERKVSQKRRRRSRMKPLSRSPIAEVLCPSLSLTARTGLGWLARSLSILNYSELTHTLSLSLGSIGADEGYSLPIVQG